MIDNEKFPEDKRTFQTRLEFIRDMFSDLHPQWEIMKKCIEHKLDRSLMIYVDELEKSVRNLEDKDPIKVIRNA